MVRLFDSVLHDIGEITEALGTLYAAYVGARISEDAETLGLNP